MDDWAGAIAASEINEVVVAESAGEEIPTEDAVSARFDAAGAMAGFEVVCSFRKITMAYDERRAIEGKRGAVRTGEIDVIEKDCADAGPYRGGIVRVNIRVSN